LGLANWSHFKVAEKGDVFQSHVLVREVKIGKATVLAAILQNTKVSSSLYNDFNKVQADDVAKSLLKSFSPKYEKEMLENVSLYRTQTDLDHIRLLVKKRKNDFLISFAFVKRAYLYRSYNETDFFQRLFIASENKKSAESKTSKLFHLPTLLFSEPAQAAGFSLDGSGLLSSINTVSRSVHLNSLGNFSFAAQNIYSNLDQLTNSINNGANAINNGAKGLQQTTTALQAIPGATSSLKTSIDSGAKTIESSLGTATKTIKDPKTWVAAGAAFQVGTMFSNVVALGVNTAYTAMRNVLLDFLSIYKPGEKEKILEQADRAWREYESLSEQMYQLEKEMQDLEIALQLATGKSIEEIYNLDEKELSNATSPIHSSLASKACTPGNKSPINEIEKLRGLAQAINNNPEVRRKLCERVDRNMELIEKLATELTLVRTRLSNSMFVTYNTIYKDKQSSLEAPTVTNKAIKDCIENAKADIKSDEYRLEKWNCDRSPNDTRCESLKKFIEKSKKDIANCDQKGALVLARDDEQYIATRAALANSKDQMDLAMEEFLMADCEGGAKESYCKGQIASAAKVKAAYNKGLSDLKSNQCRDTNLKAERFSMSKEVYSGNLPTSQMGLTPITTGASVSSSANEIPSDQATRKPASSDSTVSESNGFAKSWNAFLNGVKSLFSWFGK